MAHISDSQNGFGTIDDGLLLDDLSYQYAASAARSHVQNVPTRGGSGLSDPYAVVIPGVDASEWNCSDPSHAARHTFTGESGAAEAAKDEEEEEEEEEAGRHRHLEARLRALTHSTAPTLTQSTATSSPQTAYHVYNGDGDAEEDEEESDASEEGHDLSVFATNPVNTSSGFGGGGGGGIDDGLDDFSSQLYGVAMNTSGPLVVGALESEDVYFLDPEGGIGGAGMSLPLATTTTTATSTVVAIMEIEGGGSFPVSSSYRPHEALRTRQESSQDDDSSDNKGQPIITLTRPGSGGGRVVISPSAAEAAAIFLNASQCRQPSHSDQARGCPRKTELASSADDHNDKAGEEDEDAVVRAVAATGSSWQHLDVPSATSLSWVHSHRMATPPSTSAASSSSSSHVHSKSWHLSHASAADRRTRPRLPHNHSAETCEGSIDNHSRETLDSLVPASSTFADDFDPDRDDEEDDDDDDDTYTSDDADTDEREEGDDGTGTLCGSVATVSTSAGGSTNSRTWLRSEGTATNRSTPLPSSHRTGSGGGSGGGRLGDGHSHRHNHLLGRRKLNDVSRHRRGPQHHYQNQQQHHQRRHQGPTHALHQHQQQQQHTRQVSSSSFTSAMGEATRQASTLSPSDDAMTNAPSPASSNFSIVAPFTGSPTSRSSPSAGSAPVDSVVGGNNNNNSNSSSTGEQGPHTVSLMACLPDTVTASLAEVAAATRANTQSQHAPKLDKNTDVKTRATLTGQRDATTTPSRFQTRSETGMLEPTRIAANPRLQHKNATDDEDGGTAAAAQKKKKKTPADVWDPTESVLSQHNKHVFILTRAGKPVFSRYGECNDLSGLFGMLQVLMSIADEDEASAQTAAAATTGTTVRADNGSGGLRHILSRYWKTAEDDLYVSRPQNSRTNGGTRLSHYLSNELDPLGLFDDDDDDDEEEEEENKAAHDQYEPQDGRRRPTDGHPHPSTRTNTRSTLVAPDDSSDVDDAEDMALRDQTPPFSFSFYPVGELILVMATRHLDETPQYCVWQLQLLHTFLLSVLPNMYAILRDAPGYDIRRHFSVADVALMRALLKRCSNEVSFHLGTMEWAVTAASRSATRDRSVSRRSWFMAHFARHHQRCVASSRVEDSSERAASSASTVWQPNKNHLFSFVFCQGRLVAAAGDIASNVDHDAHKNNSAHCLAQQDLFLLEHFAQHVVRRQRGGGANWSPLCLPSYNGTGYVWVYVCDLSTRARESWWNTVLPPSSHMQTQIASTSLPLSRSGTAATTEALLVHSSSASAPPLFASAEGKAPGLLYVQVSASPNDFSYCDDNTNQLCDALLAPVSHTQNTVSRGGRGGERVDETEAAVSRSVLPESHGLTFFLFEEDVAGRPMRGGHARLFERYCQEKPVRDQSTASTSRRRRRHGGGGGGGAHQHSGQNAEAHDEAQGDLVIQHSDAGANDSDENESNSNHGDEEGSVPGSSFLRSSFSSSSVFRFAGLSGNNSVSSVAAANTTPLWSRPSLIRHIVTFGTHLAPDKLAASAGGGGGGGAGVVGPPLTTSMFAAATALHHLPSLEDQLFCVQWFSVVGCAPRVSAPPTEGRAGSNSSSGGGGGGAGGLFRRVRRRGEGVRGVLTSGSGGCESTLLSVGKRERKSVLRRLNGWVNQLRRLSDDPSQFACLIVEEADFSAVLLIPTAAVMTQLCQQVYPSEDLHSTVEDNVNTSAIAKTTQGTTAFSTSSSSSAGVMPHTRVVGVPASPAYDRSYALRCPYRLAHPPYVFSEFLEASQAAVGELVMAFLPGTPEMEMLYWSMRMLHGVVALQEDLFVPLYV